MIPHNRLIQVARLGYHAPMDTKRTPHTENNDLLILADDYARLRSIATDHPLWDELDKATILPRENMPDDVVTMNRRFTYVDEHTGISRDLELVFPEDTDPAKGRISVLAPVGSALLGLAVGQSIDWEFPDEQIHRLRVQHVEESCTTH